MEKILIIGATSAIAEAVARIEAERGVQLALCGRDTKRLDDIAKDLRLRGATRVSTHQFDAGDLKAHATLIDNAWREMGGFDTVLIAHGTLPDQEVCSVSNEMSMREFAINGTSVISLAGIIASKLQNGGTLAAISSVAGDRGRASNYLYGSAKAAVSVYMSGLGQAVREKGINVLTVKPGFVDTPMTAQFKKSILWASPEFVAKGIVRAIDKRKPVAYLPGFWWGIMWIIKQTPESVFRKLKF